MPIKEEDLPEVGLRYRVAFAAYLRCVGMVAKATMIGNAPSAALLDETPRALRELTDARRSFLTAMIGA